MTNEPEPILWINPKEMLEISQRVGQATAFWHFELVNMTAHSNGVISQEDAILILTDLPEKTAKEARQTIEELVCAGLIKREGDTLTLTVFGKTVVPDYDDWATKD